MKWLAFILVAFSAQAQFNFRDLALMSQGSTPVSVTNAATFMPGLYEYWEFTDLTTNTAVTNWIGKLQGIILTNGASARQPTNSASGVGFSPTGSIGLTNLPVDIGTNYMVAVFCQPTRDGGALSCMMPMVGPYNGWVQAPVFGAIFAGSGVMQEEWRKPNGTAGALGATTFAISATYDFVYCNSNITGTADTGKTIYYRNGVYDGLGSYSPDDNQLSGVGYMSMSCGASDYFSGFIQGIYLMTNTQAQTQNAGVTASNIHYYRTNFLTKGASP